LQLYSQEFSNWVLGGATVTSNNVISPDGTQNADTVNFTSGGPIEQQIFYAADNLTHTVSVYAKVPSGTATFRLKITHAGVANYYSPYFTATTTWQRFTFSQAFGSGGTGFFSGVDGNGAILNLWGFQLEPNSAYPTSYIPTTSTSVTRLADSCYKTGISSLIGQTQGTIFFQINNLSELDYPEITIDDNTNSNRIVFTRDTSSQFGIFIQVSGVATSVYSSTTGNSGKFAIAYSASGFSLYRNGVEIATISNAIPNSLSCVRLNGRATNDFLSIKTISQFILFQERLTDTELAQLTTI
jgi:hypothetical protein